MTTFKVRVYHGSYGCDTGCCGHYMEITKDGKFERELFQFAHPDDLKEAKAWAKEKFEYHLGQYVPECLATIDWETIEVEEVLTDDYC